jgi:Beta-propeller repeat
MCPSPATLDFSTFLGGSGLDRAYAVAVDAAGNSYVTGQTSSKDFPVTSGALQTKLAANSQAAFVAKFNPAGGLVYATYLGGRGVTFGDGIAVDQFGDAYVTGKTTSANFPVMNALQSKYGGGQSDAFAAKLNATGTALLYSTYLGGSGDENVTSPFDSPTGGIAVDQNGNAYVTGSSSSSNFPTLNGLPGISGSVFVTRLNTDAVGAASLVYSTFLNANTGTGIAIDSAGDAYVTGVANAALATTPGAFLTSGSGGYVVELNTNAVGSSALVYASYLSARGLFPHGIAVDQNGNAYVAGMANAATLPATANAFQPTYDSGVLPDDAFVLVLNPTGSGVVYASYFGGRAYDWANAVAVDGAGHIYITGFTESSDLPTVNANQSTINGGEDAFVAEFNPAAATGSASLIYSSYLGGSQSDTGYGIAVDSTGDAIVVGQASAGFPTMNAFQSSFHDAFVTKIAPPA